MGNIFADRISDVPRSFIREILKLAVDESVISFAGGLPNRDLFPLEEIKKATNKLLEASGKDVLQYSSSEGFIELREWIADRYRSKQIHVHPDHILITSGSQQGMDLLGKTLLNDGDNVIIEEPGYLGAIQAFSIYKSTFHPVPVNEEGIELDPFHEIVSNHYVKMFYCVPNFQNPSGISYSEENRKGVTHILKGKRTILVEDDPYGELRFLGKEKPSFYQLMPENTVLLGSFSKTVVPSFRIGWIVANNEIMEKLVIAKQASDLHTNYFGQRIIHQYLKDNDIDEHISRIRHAYGKQRDAMVGAIQEYFPAEIAYTHPEGGMFLWVTLPLGMSAMQVFKEAVRQKVAFVPGDPFYVNRKDVTTLRLNYSSVDEETIRIGINRLGNVLKTMIAAK
ncbi:MAG: PLP-dependent aminotransferase family protein [Nitrospirae bacterium]|nr:PLP-dependent aminotransferase family protein [Nitrospirota bacterium]